MPGKCAEVLLIAAVCGRFSKAGQGTPFASSPAVPFTCGRRGLLNTGSRGRALFRLTAQLAVVAALLLLAIANIRVRATWTEMEDGVLWNAGPDGLQSHGRSRPPRLRPARASGVVTSSKPSMAGRSTRRRTSLPGCTPLPAESRSPTPSRARARRKLVQVRLAPIPSGARGLYYVLAAVGIFSLLVGAAVRVRQTGQPGHAPLPLADDRVLRRACLLVQRTVRHPRLVLLLGGRLGAADAAAAVRPLHAGVPGSPRQLDPQRCRPNRGAAPVSARAAPRRGPCRGAAARA